MKKSLTWGGGLMPFRENTPCENKLRINLSGGISCHLKKLGKQISPIEKFRRTGFYPIRKTISSYHLAANRLLSDS